MSDVPRALAVSLALALLHCDGDAADPPPDPISADASNSGGTSGVGATSSTGGSAGAAGSVSGDASATGGAAGTSSRVEILHATFESAALGTYSESEVMADFGAAPTWNDGLDEGRASIEEESDNRFLRVTYPAGEYGPAEGGVQFKVSLRENHEELYFSYRVRFGSGFDFVKGGKLPGLVGGTAPTGCSPDPNGFSARNMWRTGGAAVQYVYYPTQPNSCGDDLPYAARFTPGSWQTVVHRIAMNTPGSADGRIEAWVDGQLVLRDAARLWRNAGATYAIDTLYFSTFFGGSDATWAPAAAQVIDFDDLIVERR